MKDEDSRKKGEGIPAQEVITKEMLDDFIAVSKYLSESVGIERKVYGQSDQLETPLSDPKA